MGARILEQLGFANARFSEIIDDEILRQGEVPTRSLRQRVGYKLHGSVASAGYQSRLSREFRREPLVIDGLRWPEDVATLRNHWRAIPSHSY